MNEKTKKKFRPGVMVGETSNWATLVWMSPEGSRMAKSISPLGKPAGGWSTVGEDYTLVPLEDWEFQVQDGTWWCRGPLGGHETWLVQDGVIYDGHGCQLLSEWEPVEYLGPLPSTWCGPEGQNKHANG